MKFKVITQARGISNFILLVPSLLPSNMCFLFLFANKSQCFERIVTCLLQMTSQTFTHPLQSLRIRQRTGVIFLEYLHCLKIFQTSYLKA